MKTRTVGVILCSRSLITYLNPFAGDLLGYLPEELVGRPMRELYFDSMEYEQVRGHAHQTIIQKEEFIYSLRGKSKTGEPVFLQIAGQLLDPEQSSAGTIWLITPLVPGDASSASLEEASKLRKQLEETERFNRLASEREFRVIELKGEVNSWAGKSGEPAPYATFINPRLQNLKTSTSKKSFSQLELSELIDINEVGKLLRCYCKSTGIASAIIDLEGNVLAQSNWQAVCTQFHRTESAAQARCVESDTQLALQLKQGQPFAHHRCENGLTDVASPILVSGQHVANVFVGQFFEKPADMDFFARQGSELGFEQTEYLAAIQKITVIEPGRLEEILQFLSEFTSFIASLAFDRARAMDAVDQANLQSLELSRERGTLLSLAEDAEQARSQTAKYQDQLELLVEARTEELNKANQAKDRILSILSHDLRGPIGNFAVVFDLISRGEMLLDDGLGNSIAASALNLSNLLEDLLSWTQQQGGLLQADRTVFSANDILLPVIDLLRTSAHSKSIKLSSQEETSLCCFGDPALISTVLRNLIGNAIKFTPQGGTVEVTCTEESGKVRFEVADTGSGLHHDDLRQLLLGSGVAMSKRGTAYEQGSGLGLTLCRDFLKLNDSQIEGHSQMGQGTQFWFELPLRAKEELASSLSDWQPQSLGDYLLVENDPINLKTSSLVLKGLGLSYHVVRTGSAALAAAQKGSYGVVLIDLDVLELRNVEAADLILEHCQPAPLVIGLTKSSPSKIDESFEFQRLSGVLEKPIHPQLLNALLQRLAGS